VPPGGSEGAAQSHSQVSRERIEGGGSTVGQITAPCFEYLARVALSVSLIFLMQATAVRMAFFFFFRCFISIETGFVSVVAVYIFLFI